jgi:hypothetical protein
VERAAIGSSQKLPTAFTQGKPQLLKPRSILLAGRFALHHATPKELLRNARDFNHGLGISGMLVHDDGCFMQVLEWPKSAVDGIYTKIEKDPRHTNSRLLYRGLEKNREFEDWSMGFVDTSGAAANSEGFVSYSSLKLAVAGKTRARNTLSLFQEGTWRQKVNFGISYCINLGSVAVGRRHSFAALLFKHAASKGHGLGFFGL